MSEEILSLTYDRHSSKITLSGSEEHFSAGGYSVVQSQNLVLTSDDAPQWDTFLDTLAQIYRTDAFHIDFYGSRADLDALQTACNHSGDLTAELYYEGVHADNLPSLQYRADRLVSMYEKIGLYCCSYLNRQFFLNPFRELIYDRLNTCLDHPDKSDLDLIDTVLHTGQLCLEEARDAFHNEKLRQETARNGDRFLSGRLSALQDVSFRLLRLTWNGMSFMNPESLAKLCRQDLQRLTDSVTASGKATDPSSDAELQMLYCLFVRSCELAIKEKADLFVEKTGKQIQKLQSGPMWKNIRSMTDYPALVPFTGESIPWEPVIPKEMTDPGQQLRWLHDYADSLIGDICRQYHRHYEDTWNELMKINDQNIARVSEEISLLQELTEDSRKREQHDRIRLEEEHKEIEAAQQFLEELEILLLQR